jgi:hypothetical protein
MTILRPERTGIPGQNDLSDSNCVLIGTSRHRDQSKNTMTFGHDVFDKDKKGLLTKIIDVMTAWYL